MEAVLDVGEFLRSHVAVDGAMSMGSKDLLRVSLVTFPPRIEVGGKMAQRRGVGCRCWLGSSRVAVEPMAHG